MNTVTPNSPARRKVCKVCNGDATGWNYQQLTCESCKVFFHRYGFHLNRFKCKAVNQCPIEARSRIKCKACRLQKCLEVGMVRTVENKQSSNSQVILETSNDNQALVPIVPVSTTTQTTEIESQKFLEELFTNVPHFVVSPFNGLSSMNPSVSSSPFDPLSDFESTKIAEILQALDVVADERALPVVARTDNYYAAFQSAEIYVRMFIRFCKRMSHFSLLSNEDQMAILKPFCFDILCIRFAFTVDFSDPEGGYWNSVLDEGATTTLAAPFNLKAISRIIRRQHDKFIENFEFTKLLQVELEGDPVIRDLLTALVMFKNHISISCSEFIKYNFTFYSRLLQKYLEQKYASRTKAEQKLATLVRLIMTFDHIKNNEKLLFYEMDLQQIPVVYHEIYDL